MSTLVKNGGKPPKMNMNWIQVFLQTNEYHNLKITQKLSLGLVGYTSTNNAVLILDIDSMLDNFSLAATVDQINANHLMEKIHQLKRKNTLGEQIKKMANTNTIMEREGQDRNNKWNKNESYFVKLDPIRYYCTHGCRVTKGKNSCSYKK